MCIGPGGQSAAPCWGHRAEVRCLTGDGAEDQLPLAVPAALKLSVVTRAEAQRHAVTSISLRSPLSPSWA